MHLLQSGISLEIIRDFLGHAHVLTTQIYRPGRPRDETQGPRATVGRCLGAPARRRRSGGLEAAQPGARLFREAGRCGQRGRPESRIDLGRPGAGERIWVAVLTGIGDPCRYVPLSVGRRPQRHVRGRRSRQLGPVRGPPRQLQPSPTLPVRRPTKGGRRFIALLGRPGAHDDVSAARTIGRVRGSTVQGSQVAFEFSVTPRLLFIGLGSALSLGAIGGLLPALRAARLPVIAALRAG